MHVFYEIRDKAPQHGMCHSFIYGVQTQWLLMVRLVEGGGTTPD